MRRSWLVLPLVILTTPLAAQRQPSASRTDSRQLMRELDELSLAGYASAYKGVPVQYAPRRGDPVTRFPRPETGIRLAPGVAVGGYVATASERADHWFAIGQRAGTPTTLRRAPVGNADARADIPLAVTLVSPIGGPGRALMIRTAVATAGTNTPDAWSRMGEVRPDANGVYRVDVPALHVGTYELDIEVYDLQVPELPYSSSKSTLVVWTP